MYHIVWTPKYSFRVLAGKVKDLVEDKIKKISEWYSVEIEEMSIQPDHVLSHFMKIMEVAVHSK